MHNYRKYTRVCLKWVHLLFRLEDRKMGELKEIAIVNRNKIAWLYTNGIFEDRIEKIYRNGKEQYAFIFTATDTVRDLLTEFDENVELKRFCSNFKSVAFTIKKYKEQEE
jgi:hypothetical protein